MTQSPSEKKSQSSSVGKFLDKYDSVYCDPIEVSDDGDDNPLNPFKTDDPSATNRRKAIRQTNGIRTERQRAAETRDEERLLGGLIRRKDTDAFVIADPMAKRSSLLRGTLVPMDTLTQPASSRARFEKEKLARSCFGNSDLKTRTHPSRNEYRENNHSVPLKKARTGPSPWTGGSQQEAIKVLDSQEEVKSVNDMTMDEVSPESAKECKGTSMPHNPFDSTSQTHGLSNMDGGRLPSRHSNNHTSREDASSAKRRFPSRNSDYSNDLAMSSVRKSTSQRKAELDDMLGSSSSMSIQNEVESILTSPYFGSSSQPIDVTTPKKGGNGAKAVKHDYTEAESPDELQTDEVSATLPPSNRPATVRARVPLSSRIVGNSESTKITRREKSNTKNNHPSISRYPLKNVKCSGLPEFDGYTFEIDPKTRQFAFGLQDQLMNDPVSTWYPTMKIIGAYHGGDHSDKLALKLSRSSDVPEKILMQAESHKVVYDILACLASLDGPLKVHQKDSDWMDRMFSRVDEDAEKPYQKPPVKDSQMQASTKNDQGLHVNDTTVNEKRVRRVDRLDAPEVKQVPNSAQKSNLAQDSRNRNGNDDDLPTAREILRETRSSSSRTRKQSALSQAQEENQPPRIKYSTTGKLGEPWKRPLVYPRAGKKRETVQFDDLWRLDDDEFLNDSLVGFFLRYLEHQLETQNPNVYKKMYFFNSYFYDTLIKGMKGKKGVNYDGVAKWTRSINIFSRDFVVVPVNENLHWYVAIICNLPYLVNRNRTDEEEDNGYLEDSAEIGQEVTDRNDTTQNESQVSSGPADDTQKSFAELTLEDKEITNNTVELESSGTTKSSSTPKRGKKKHVRRSLPKYETSKPIIITLDSLAIARSATCTVLRQYVAHEAWDKRNLEIDPSELRGMTAKDIPTQGNYSDCGLYLCMYLEQFARDPYGFVSRILQREKDSEGWPKTINSEDLRSRLRDMIMQLHREQENDSTNTSVPVVGKILIDKTEIVTAAQSNSNSNVITKEELRDARSRYFETRKMQANETEKAPDPKPQSEPAKKSSPSASPPKTPTKSKAEPILIEDEDSSASQLSPQVSRANDSSHKSWDHSEPNELARQMQEARSPTRNKKGKDQQTDQLRQSHRKQIKLSQQSPDDQELESEVPETQQLDSQSSQINIEEEMLV